MKVSKFVDFGIDEIIFNALKEDVGSGDITTLACVPETARSVGEFRAKETGVFCGAEVLQRVFALLDARVAVTLRVEDGDEVSAGDVIAAIEGPSRAILTGERVALNLVQRLSGIATRTAACVAAIEGYSAKITDTRKTTPGLRILEKYAVRCGGGFNHRFALYDGVLIKDNHIKAAGGITQALSAAREAASHLLKIEVEVETSEQITEALEARADVIMLDNMNIEQMREAVALVAGRAITEASGNMGDRDLREVAATGVDLISVGALTHTVRALDISLKFID